MQKTIIIAACQMPDVLENLEQSLNLVVEYALQADLLEADLVCFPECYLQGYIVNDRTRHLAIDLDSDAFQNILVRLAEIRPILVIGLIELAGQKVFNTAIVVKEGRLLGCYRKVKLLPGENGVFSPGRAFRVFEIKGFKFGINICYDLNFPECTQAFSSQGIDFLVCPCNNMMRYENAEKWKGKHNESRIERAKEGNIWLISSDVTGERDGRISYGPTALINTHGEIVAQVPLLQEGMILQKITF
jgi:5-aminopentanamidase